jgi:hypothetical protein
MWRSILCFLGVIGAHANSATPNFNRDIASIIYQNCSNCHRPGEVAPFPLLTYEDVAKRAKQIAAITKARYMPPWKATEAYGHFLDERRLTDGQIAAIGEWAGHGAPEGDPSQKPAPPKFAEGWLAGEPDKVVRMPQPFTLPADGADEFRCFVIPLGAESEEYVQTVEFRPGNRRIVHHALFFLDNSGAARQKEITPGQGYSCVGGPGLPISGGLGGWAPGAPPSTLPPGVAHPIEKGADLIMQIHYHLDGKPEQDQSSLGLTFAKVPPSKGLVSLIIGNRRIDIPAGDDHYVVRASSVVPMDAEAIAITPHAHYLCKDMKVDAHLPDGGVQPMIWIKDWDFNWQGAYRYASPLKLPKGTRIEMQYTYDNSGANPHNPSNPPREVMFGEQTTNEMAFTFVTLTLASPAQVTGFRRAARAELVASLLEEGLDPSLSPQAASRLKALLTSFDKNHNGKIDPDERPALVEFLENFGRQP